MEEVMEPEAGALDFLGLSALLQRNSRHAREHDAALRNALLRGHGSILSDRERSLLWNLLHVLVADMGASFRRALAVRQGEGDAAADALAATLDERWAETMQTKLAKIGVVGDLELIAAMEHRVLEHLLDAAQKPRGEDGIAAPSGEAAADPFGDEEFATDIWLGKAVSDYLVEKSRRFDGYANPRLPLYELGPDLAGRLFWATAALWRDEVLPGWAGDEGDLDDALEFAVARALDSAIADAKRLDKLIAVADALADSGRLRPHLLPALVLGGELGIFEAAMARLLDLPLALVRSMTFEPGGARIAVAARAVGIGPTELDAIDRAVSQVRHPASAAEPTAGELFRRCSVDDAERMVRHWRRRPEYLEALRRYGAPGADQNSS